jgi:hypothetical protein
MAGRIFMKIGMNVMPWVTTPNSYYVTSYTRKYERDGCLKSWGGMLMTTLPMILCAWATLALPNLNLYNSYNEITCAETAFIGVMKELDPQTDYFFWI